MLCNQTQNIDGIVLIDKPYGVSSNYVVQQLKNILQIKKAGHTGSLDLLATGMLPICCGEATKIAQFLIDLNKRYRVIAKLGQKTSTADSEGFVIKSRAVNFNLIKLEEVLNKFRGSIRQIPPMYSALKYKGQSLYKYARKGIYISRKSRNIIIYKLDYIYHINNFLELDVICSKGTYIRTLIEDLGEHLNCGAHVQSLCRLQVNSYSMSKMISINELKKIKIFGMTFLLKYLSKFIISINNSISFIPEVNIKTDVLKKLKYGQKVQLIEKFNNQFVRITEGITKNFIGIGKLNNLNELRFYRMIK